MSTNIPLNLDNTTFQYAKIEGRDGFRLLRLFSGKREDPIQCELITSHVYQAAGTYTALSYVWGTDEATNRITVDDQEFWVRRNLFDALRRLRPEDKDLVIFIDAICINQGDLVERSSLVRIMGDIYRGAKCTFAWLGEGDEQTIDKCWRTMEVFLSRRRPSNWRDMKMESALEPLYLHEYWSRVWIVPEVQVSQEVCILWGSRMIEWKQLEDSDALFQALHFAFLLHPIPWASISPSIMPLISIRKMRRPRLVQLLLDYKSSRCQDPRDFVYALSAVAKDRNLISLTVDYSQDLVSLLWEVLDLDLKTKDGGHVNLSLALVLARQFRIAGSNLVSSVSYSALDYRLDAAYQGELCSLGVTARYGDNFMKSHRLQSIDVRSDVYGAARAAPMGLLAPVIMSDALIGDVVVSCANAILGDVKTHVYFVAPSHMASINVRGFAFSFRGDDIRIDQWRQNFYPEDFQVLFTHSPDSDRFRIATNRRGLAWLVQFFLGK